MSTRDILLGIGRMGEVAKSSVALHYRTRSGYYLQPFRIKETTCMTAMVAKMLLAINKHLNKSDYFEIISSCMHSQLLAKHATNALVKALM